MQNNYSKVTIAGPWDEILEIEVDPSSTIQNLLDKITNQNTASKDILLCVNGQPITDLTSEVKNIGNYLYRSDSTRGKVLIKYLNCKRVSLNTSTTDTVLRLKELLHEREGTMIEQMKMIYKGQEMKDQLTLGQYQMDFRTEPSVQIVFRMPGGSTHS